MRALFRTESSRWPLYLGLVVVAFSDAALAQEQLEPAQIIARMRERFQNISSAQVGAHSVSQYLLSPDQISELKADTTGAYEILLRGARLHDLSILHDGDRFKSTSRISYSNSAEQEVREETYDGEKYWSFDAAGLIISSTSNNNPNRLPYRTEHHPLSVSFDFVWWSLETTPSLENLQSKDVWDPVAAASGIVGTESVGGISCVVLEVRLPYQNIANEQITHRVYTAPDYDYYPIRVESFRGDGYRFHSVESTNMKEIAGLDGRPVFVAGRIEIIDYDWYGSGTTVYTKSYVTDFDTLRLNISFPDTIFTLSPTMADVYFDMDTRENSFSVYASDAPQTEGLSVDLNALQLLSSTGERIDLRDLEGNVVLINVFATWCGPCNEEIPHLIGLHDEFYDKGLRIVSVSRKERPEVVEDFVKAKGIAYTVMLDPDGKGTDQFSLGRSGVPVPTNIVLDRRLKPVFKDVGFTEDRFAILRAKIVELLD